MKFPTLLLSLTPLWAISVTTGTGDVNGTSANTQEFHLSLETLSSARFGKTCSVATDGQMWGQILYVPRVAVSGVTHDLAIAASMHDTVYAIDRVTCGVVWSTSVGTSWSPYPTPFANITELGCLSTPAIDEANNILYISCATNTPTWTLFKIDLTDGSILDSEVMGGQVTGTGDTAPSMHMNCGYNGNSDTTSGPNLLFNALFELQRPGIRFYNGKIYVTFGGIGDNCPYHGWIIAYDTTLTRIGIWCSTPNGWGGAIWGGGAQPSIDSDGNVYVTTGNGTDYDGTTTFTNSVVKLTPTLSMIGDWFEPANNVTINALDADVSANRFLIIPGTIYGVIAAKDFWVYVIDTTCMGHLQGSSGCTLQSFQTNASGTTTQTSGSYGLVFANNTLILPLTSGWLYSFTYNPATHQFTTTPNWNNNTSFGFPGPAQMTYSSYGATNTLLWTITAASSAFTTSRAATLHAIDVSSGIEVWNSGDRSADNPGQLSKFSQPTVADGYVMIPTLNQGVVIFGPLGGVTQHGAKVQ